MSGAAGRAAAGSQGRHGVFGIFFAEWLKFCGSSGSAGPEAGSSCKTARPTRLRTFFWPTHVTTKMSCSWAKSPQELDASSEQMGWLASENLSTFRKVGRQCIFHFKISASRDDWLRFFFYPFSFACILGMEHVQPWEPGRDWKSNMIGQIHMHRVACRMEVSNFKLDFLSIVSSNFNSV